MAVPTVGNVSRALLGHGADEEERKSEGGHEP